MGNVLEDDLTLENTQHTIPFFSSSDPNSHCLITFAVVPQPPVNREELHAAVASSTRSVVPSSVEGKAIVRDLKLKQGIGAVASFADASLVGKPKKPGDAKALASGMIILKPGLLGVVSMFMDDAQGPDAEKMLQALETLSIK